MFWSICLADLPSAVRGGEDVECLQTEETPPAAAPSASANTVAGADRVSCMAAVLSAKGASQESFTRQGKSEQAFPN